MKSFVRMFGLMAVAFLLGVAACLAEEAPAAAPAMTPEQQAQMEKVKQQMSPGEPHKALEQLAGNWNYTAKFKMGPDAPAQETTGTSLSEMIYGGRFLKESVKGTFNGEPFEGISYTGYDNVKGEYSTVWVDSMATGMMKMSGQYDATTKTLNMSGSNACPMTGQKDMPMRSVTKVVDANHFTMEHYMTGTDSQEIKHMEIAYTRA